VASSISVLLEEVKAREVDMDGQDVRKALSGAQDVITARRVFGKAYERNGVVVIPAAKIAGGGGGGSGEGPNGSGSGAGVGFGLGGKPAGAYVIKGDRVKWKPALDMNAIIARGQVIAMLTIATILVRETGRRRRRRGRRRFF
jgi:uncharacterized spore protein YtfJ